MLGSTGLFASSRVAVGKSAVADPLARPSVSELRYFQPLSFSSSFKCNGDVFINVWAELGFLYMASIVFGAGARGSY